MAVTWFLQFGGHCWKVSDFGGLNVWVFVACNPLMEDWLCHYIEVSWVSWCVKSLATQLFVQQPVCANNNENTDTLYSVSLWEKLPVTDGFPSPRANSMESISMLWCHHDAAMAPRTLSSLYGHIDILWCVIDIVGMWSLCLWRVDDLRPVWCIVNGSLGTHFTNESWAHNSTFMCKSMLMFSLYKFNQVINLYMSWQQSCHGMCKIMTWSNH